MSNSQRGWLTEKQANTKMISFCQKCTLFLHQMSSEDEDESSQEESEKAVQIEVSPEGTKGIPIPDLQNLNIYFSPSAHPFILFQVCKCSDFKLYHRYWEGSHILSGFQHQFPYSFSTGQLSKTYQIHGVIYRAFRNSDSQVSPQT